MNQAHNVLQVSQAPHVSATAARSVRRVLLTRIAAASMSVIVCMPLAASPQVIDETVIQSAPTASPDKPVHAATEPSKRPLGIPAKSDNKRELGLKSPGAAASSSSGLIKTTLSLGVVLVLIVLVAKVAKRFLGPKLGMAASLGPAKAPSGILEIIGRYPLGSGLSILLLKVDRRVLVLSQSTGKLALRGGGASLATLCEIVDAEEVASILTKSRDAEGDSIAARFRELLDTYSGSDDPAEAADPPDVQPREPRGGKQKSPVAPVAVVTASPRMPSGRLASTDRKLPATSDHTGVIA